MPEGTDKFPKPAKRLEQMSNAELHRLIQDLNVFMPGNGLGGIIRVNNDRLNRRQAHHALNRLSRAGLLGS